MRSPAVFFASSHAEGWEEQQLRRLSKLHPPPSSREGGGWVGQVVAHHCELLAQGTEGETNALLLLWRERMLEAIDLLHGGGEQRGRGCNLQENKRIIPFGTRLGRSETDETVGSTRGGL